MNQNALVLGLPFLTVPWYQEHRLCLDTAGWIFQTFLVVADLVGRKDNSSKGAMGKLPERCKNRFSFLARVDCMV